MDDKTSPDRSLFRRLLTERWRLIFAFWILGSVGLGYLGYREFPPYYRASSLLRCSPTATDLFNLENGNPESVAGFLQTQTSLITGPNVLSAAGTNSKAANLPRIKEAGDVVLELRKVIKIAIIPGTYLIEVSMDGPSAQEAAILVNAVVEAFIESSVAWSEGMTRSQVENLESYLADLRNQSDDKERRLKDLANKGDDGRKGDQRQARIETKRLDNDLQRLDARSRLDALDQLVAEAKIAEADAAPQRAELLTKVRAAEILDKALVAKADQLRAGEAGSAVSLDISLLQQTRASLVGMQETVRKRLEQLKFELRSEARIRLVNVAVPPGKPLPNGRLTIALAVAPLLALLGSIGLGGLAEGLGAFRRSDPAEGAFGPI